VISELSSVPTSRILVAPPQNEDADLDFDGLYFGHCARGRGPRIRRARLPRFHSEANRRRATAPGFRRRRQTACPVFRTAGGQIERGQALELKARGKIERQIKPLKVA
jgi:hypothetical protein